MEIITNKDTNYEIMNPITTHSFKDSHPVELNAPTEPVYEEIEQSQSHYELDDEEAVKKGEDEVPLYVPILDGPSLISSPPTTTNPTTDSFNKMWHYV